MTAVPTKHPVERSRHPRLQALLDETPGYAVAAEIAKRALAQVRDLDAAGAAPAPRPETLADLTDDWMDTEVQRRIDATAVAAKRQALLDLATVATDEATMLANDAAEDHLLVALAGQLEDVITAVRDTLDRLDNATTAQQAIDRGTTDAWSELTDLRRTYDDIRNAADIVYATQHANLAGRARSDEPDTEASALRWMNLDQIAPDWRVSARTGHGSTHIPWPSDPVEALAWLLREGGLPWIPTPREAGEHLNTREQELRAAMNLANVDAGGNIPTTTLRTATQINKTIKREFDPHAIYPRREFEGYTRA